MVLAVPALLATALLGGCDAGSADAPEAMREGEARALDDAAEMLGEQRLADDLADKGAKPDGAQGDPGTQTAP